MTTVPIPGETVANNLRKAANIIEQRGLFKGDFIDPDSRAVCILGAINVAKYGVASPRALDQLGIERQSVYATAEARVMKDFLNGSPDSWNDMPERTKEEVINALRDCAAQLTEPMSW